MVIVKLECQTCEAIEQSEGAGAIVFVKKEDGSTAWLIHDLKPEEVIVACEQVKFAALRQLCEAGK